MILTSLRLFLWMTLLTGVVYPLLITLIGSLTFPTKRNGDLIEHLKKPVGFKLIGQKFESDRYFFSRPSSIDYNALSSGGSNLGPTSLELRKIVQTRKENMVKAHPNQGDVPSDLLFASGSGLDPHISKEAAYFQIDRIVKARNLDSLKGKEMLKELVDSLVEKPKFWLSRKPYVNVLLLNIALDKI